MPEDAVDPESLPSRYSPAIVKGMDGEEILVADHRVKKNGWLWVFGWQRSSRKFPPHRIHAVDSVPTESPPGEELSGMERIADAELRAQAKQAAGLDATETTAATTIADGGQTDGR